MGGGGEGGVMDKKERWEKISGEWALPTTVYELIADYEAEIATIRPLVLALARYKPYLSPGYVYECSFCSGMEGHNPDCPVTIARQWAKKWKGEAKYPPQCHHGKEQICPDGGKCQGTDCAFLNKEGK